MFLQDNMMISGVSARRPGYLPAPPVWHRHTQNPSNPVWVTFHVGWHRKYQLWSLQDLFCQSFGSEEKSDFMSQLEVWKSPQGFNISVRFHASSWRNIVSFQATEMDNESGKTSESSIYSNISWQGGPVGLKEQHWGSSSQSKLYVKCKSEHIGRCCWSFPACLGKFPVLWSSRSLWPTAAPPSGKSECTKQRGSSVLLCINTTVSVHDYMQSLLI